MVVRLFSKDIRRLSSVYSDLSDCDEPSFITFA
jgi:hypothetical protein